MVILLGNPAQFEHERAELKKYVKQSQYLFLELQSLIDKNSKNPNTELEELKKFTQTLPSTIEAYNQKQQTLLKKIDSKSLQPGKISAAQALLGNFTKSKEAVEFNQLSEDLSKLVKLAYQGQDKAEDDWYRAQNVCVKITIASLLLSIAIATILAVYTSRGISRPLEAIAKVAQQATKESNFNLKASVTTQDEVGTLATVELSRNSRKRLPKNFLEIEVIFLHVYSNNCMKKDYS
ncbi:hypothetical protein [Microcoleus sp. F4-D5]|uniref:hypothetical protein n=1 Tax=Microcoleus sp. F4-D5 TaxID=2818760 RepID=UPI002FD4A63C